MSSFNATVIGIALQLVGAIYLVFCSWQTSRRFAKYKNSQVTYDNFSLVVENLAHEIGSQFSQQVRGFFFVLLGSAFQLYALTAV